jgi:hypothetical protein
MELELRKQGSWRGGWLAKLAGLAKFRTAFWLGRSRLHPSVISFISYLLHRCPLLIRPSLSVSLNGQGILKGHKGAALTAQRSYHWEKAYYPPKNNFKWVLDNTTPALANSRVSSQL